MEFKVAMRWFLHSCRWALPGCLLLFSPQAILGQVDLAKSPELERRVSIQAEGVRLRVLFAKLSEAVGVTVKASKGLEETKLILLAKGEQTSSILISVAELLDAEWREGVDRSGSKEWTLYVKAASGARNAKLMRMEEDKTLASFDLYTRHAVMSKKEREALKPGDLQLRFTRYPLNAFGARLYQSLSLDQRRQLLRTGRVRYSYPGLPPRLQEEFIESVAALAAQHEKEARLDGDSYRAPSRSDIIERNTANPIDLCLRLTNAQRYVCLRYGGIGAVSLGMIENHELWVVPTHGNPYTGDLVTVSHLPPVPIIQRANEAKSLLEGLKALHEHSGTTVVADYYLANPLKSQHEGNVPIKFGESAADQLDKFCYAPGYCWWNRGQSLLFRKRDWYHQERAEPPYEWYLAFLKRSSDESFVFSSKDAAGFAKFTPIQLAATMGQGVFSEDAHESDMFGASALLRTLEEVLPVVGKITESEVITYSLGARDPRFTALTLTSSLMRNLGEHLQLNPSAPPFEGVPFTLGYMEDVVNQAYPGRPTAMAHRIMVEFRRGNMISQANFRIRQREAVDHEATVVVRKEP